MSEETVNTEQAPEPTPAPEAPQAIPETAEWYKAARTPAVRPTPAVAPMQPHERPQAFQQPPLQRPLTPDDIADNPQLLVELAADAAAKKQGQELAAIRAMIENISQGYVMDKFSRARGELDRHLSAAHQNFQESVARDPQYANPAYRQSVNEFMYRLAEYAQGHVQYCVQNNMPLPDVSYLSDPSIIEVAKVFAARSARIPAQHTQVEYQGGQTESARASTQKKTEVKRSDAEIQMLRKIGITAEREAEIDKYGGFFEEDE